MRGQVSLDLLFAVLLITVTVTNIIYLATSEIGHAETFDVLAKIKVLAITIRDHTAKIYAMGEGYEIREAAPDLNGGKIRIVFDGVSNRILVNATVNGKNFWVVSNSTVPLCSSEVEVSNGESFWIVGVYNTTEGIRCVKVEKQSPNSH